LQQRTVLAHTRSVADSAADSAAEPTRWLYMLHGIYGSGRNWSSVARRLVRERPDWGVLLVDLREHGDSPSFPPPHTIVAAAGDLDALAESTGTPPDAVLGHSFGGKVALQFASNANPSVRQVWIVDSTPEARDPAGSAWTMLGVLRGLPRRFASRSAAIEALVGEGVARPVAQWLATSLVQEDAEYRWRFDLDKLDALLRDFFRTDLWAVVEDPPAGLEVHLVKAEDSSVLSGDALERAQRAADGRRIHLHRVAGGHWVNADNPSALHTLLVTHLPSD
jgi:esterase